MKIEQIKLVRFFFSPHCRLRSTHFRAKLYMVKILVETQENFWYHLEDRTTFTSDYMAGESDFFRFLRNEAPNQPESNFGLSKKLFEIHGKSISCFWDLPSRPKKLVKPMKKQHFCMLGRPGPSWVFLGGLEGILGESWGRLGYVLEVLGDLGRQHF